MSVVRSAALGNRNVNSGRATHVLVNVCMALKLFSIVCRRAHLTAFSVFSTDGAAGTRQTERPTDSRSSSSSSSRSVQCFTCTDAHRHNDARGTAPTVNVVSPPCKVPPKNTRPALAQGNECDARVTRRKHRTTPTSMHALT
jgi:hypothetical protein